MYVKESEEFQQALLKVGILRQSEIRDDYNEDLDEEINIGQEEERGDD